MVKLWDGPTDITLGLAAKCGFNHPNIVLQFNRKVVTYSGLRESGPSFG